MKSREQKRLEAIQRLESKPRGIVTSGQTIDQLWERRKDEARRLRAVFNEHR